jgi:hypothetical protein
MKGHRYADIQAIKTATTEQLQAFQKVPSGTASVTFINAGNGGSMQGKTILKGANINNV